MAAEGPAGPALPPLCASFLAERWGVAAARAAAAQMQPDSDATEAEANRLAAVLGCETPPSVGAAELPALHALRAARVGSLVELRRAGSAVEAVLPGGISLPAVVADCAKLKKGQLVPAVVLDSDPLSRSLHVSTSPALVAAAQPVADVPETEGKKKKKRPAVAASAADDGVRRLRVGAKVTGEVALSRAGLLVVSLPKFGHALGVASHHALWSAAGAPAEALAAEAARHAVGTRVKAVVAALPEDAPVDQDDASALPPPPHPLILSLISAPVAPAAGAPDADAGSAGHRSVGPLRRAAEARPGAHALAQVVGISSSGLSVVLDKKGALRGRVHFTELVAPGQRAVLPSAPPTDPVCARGRAGWGCGEPAVIGQRGGLRGGRRRADRVHDAAA